MATKDEIRVCIGCKVMLYCVTDGEPCAYKIVKSRDTTEYVPLFGGSFENQNYDSRAKIAEYAEDELGDDRPLAKELLGKKTGDTVKVLNCVYSITDIIPPEDKSVEPISEFLARVYGDFEKYINGGNKLCDLKSAAFYGENFPEYPNEHVQQFYLLRYCLAYAYEYKQTYTAAFLRGVPAEIKVTSFGCGSMVDYWALADVIREYGVDYTVDYTGLDLADWKYKINKRACDGVRFVRKDVAAWLNETEFLDSDVYIFPKSISEFNGDGFNAICESFGNMRFAKDRFHIMITLRYDPQKNVVNEKDSERSVRIYDAVKSNGFLCDDDPHTTFPSAMLDKYVWDADGGLSFPQGFDWTILSELSEKCSADEKEKRSCLYGCSGVINRVPMLTTKYACYQIFTFYRGSENDFKR